MCQPAFHTHDPLQERMLTVLDKEASLVMAALDTSVEDAKTQIASMHLGVASCWNASVPKALAALSLSPSEFDTYLNETQVCPEENSFRRLLSPSFVKYLLHRIHSGIH